MERTGIPKRQPGRFPTTIRREDYDEFREQINERQQKILRQRDIYQHKINQLIFFACSVIAEDPLPDWIQDLCYDVDHSTRDSLEVSSRRLRGDGMGFFGLVFKKLGRQDAYHKICSAELRFNKPDTVPIGKLFVEFLDQVFTLENGVANDAFNKLAEFPCPLPAVVIKEVEKTNEYNGMHNFSREAMLKEFNLDPEKKTQWITQFAGDTGRALEDLFKVIIPGTKGKVEAMANRRNKASPGLETPREIMSVISTANLIDLPHQQQLTLELEQYNKLWQEDLSTLVNTLYQFCQDNKEALDEGRRGNVNMFFRAYFGKILSICTLANRAHTFAQNVDLYQDWLIVEEKLFMFEMEEQAWKTFLEPLKEKLDLKFDTTEHRAHSIATTDTVRFTKMLHEDIPFRELLIDTLTLIHTEHPNRPL
ncbi:hypothetical protein BJ508DRAFT_374710 [Ascobolus immersus RN42]|uniref:Uncharacterized protein n=1 Tax=Ascobolus immersus RN42 TaxID=1160509 RepID=A0A3N4ICF6_ASCIM|nr:hypothetical protein BJ508DRAFT_374710 [Ascobolus immersus RN42]